MGNKKYELQLTGGRYLFVNTESKRTIKSGDAKIDQVDITVDPSQIVKVTFEVQDNKKGGVEDTEK